MAGTLFENNLSPYLTVVEQGSTPATPSAGDQRLFIRTSDHLLCYVNSSGTVTPVSAGGSGSITSSGYTQNTARLLGRTTASAGAIEEITVGSGLSLSAGSLTATGGGGTDNWTVPLDVWMPLGNTNWNTLNISSADLFNGDVESAGNNTDEMHWDDGFSGGTWTFMLMHVTAANRGIYHVQIDGVDVGTIDGYATAPGAKNVISTVTGVSISAGKHTTKLIMASKNASSSSYFGTIQDALWRRTA